MTKEIEKAIANKFPGEYNEKARAATFGYNLSADRVKELEQEVERLKGIIDRALVCGIETAALSTYSERIANIENFKQSNNL